MIVFSCSVPVEINTPWQLQKPPESTPYSPSSELDSSSARQESPVSSHSWVKQEPVPEAIQGGHKNSETATDAEKDNNLNSAVTSTVSFHFLRIRELIGIFIFHWWDIHFFFSAAVPSMEGLPSSVMLTITKFQCLLESKQERIDSLERQVQDLQEDRRFLRSQVENLTGARLVSVPEGVLQKHLNTCILEWDLYNEFYYYILQ